MNVYIQHDSDQRRNAWFAAHLTISERWLAVCRARSDRWLAAWVASPRAHWPPALCGRSDWLSTVTADPAAEEPESVPRHQGQVNVVWYVRSPLGGAADGLCGVLFIFFLLAPFRCVNILLCRFQNIPKYFQFPGHLTFSRGLYEMNHSLLLISNSENQYT